MHVQENSSYIKCCVCSNLTNYMYMNVRRKKCLAGFRWIETEKMPMEPTRGRQALPAGDQFSISLHKKLF